MRGIVETGRYWDVETDEQIVQLRATVSAEWRAWGGEGGGGREGRGSQIPPPPSPDVSVGDSHLSVKLLFRFGPFICVFSSQPFFWSLTWPTVC